MTRATNSFEQALKAGAEGIADGISEDLHAVLSDPLVQALMAADNVDVGRLKSVLRRIAGAIRGQRSPGTLADTLC